MRAGSDQPAGTVADQRPNQSASTDLVQSPALPAHQQPPVPRHGATRPVASTIQPAHPARVDTKGRNIGDEDRNNEEGTKIKRSRKVRAIATGYYGNIRRRVGDVFKIRPIYKIRQSTTTGDVPPSRGKDDPLVEIDEFSERWMEDVDASTPERVTTGAEELKAIHDREQAERHAGGGRRGDNVIGDTDDDE
jgi:hypothetical protein